jgi:two-component system sensor kinase FixL
LSVRIAILLSSWRNLSGYASKGGTVGSGACGGEIQDRQVENFPASEFSPGAKSVDRTFGTIARRMDHPSVIAGSESGTTLAEARWRAIIDSAVDGIIVIDHRGAIEAFNRAAERLFGYPESDVLGRNVTMLMPSPFRDEHDGYMARYLETGERRIIGIGREVTALRRDGTTFPVHLSVGEFFVGSERHFTGILHDLSSRAALEERLREQTALARLGEMAAVIAHEVKNPLAAVRGAIEVIGTRLPPDSKETPVVKQILARLDALNDLLKDLLLFARPPQPKLGPVDLRSLLVTVGELLHQDPTFAGVRMEIVGDCSHIVADANLLQIVLQNLFINAAQAMSGGGNILVSLESKHGEAIVTVRDTGPGLSAEAREKLFRPFFTSKARGTGLGLSTAKRLIEAHNGTIAVESPPAGGATVTLRIPTGALDRFGSA